VHTDRVTTNDFAAAAASLYELESLDLDALHVMFRLERAGQEFYEKLAAGIGNDEAAALLRANGREELKHAERVGRAIGIKQGHDFEPSADDLAPMEVNVPEAIPVEMLPYIVAGELKGDAGYQRWADNEPDPEVERLLRLNGREETIHSERVTAVLALLQPTT
jgi:rubrerythrin